MLSGEPLLGDLEEVSDNELALSAIMLSRRDFDWHNDRVVEGELRQCRDRTAT